MSGGYRDIYSGILHKCGGRIKTWTKRWMVLRSDYCLYYYKDATKNHLGVISLRDTQFKIRIGQRSDVSWPKNLALENTFAIVTTPRVYFMYAETQAEAEEWRKVLEDAHHDLLEVTRTKSFSGFRTASVGVERDAAFTSQSLKQEGSLSDGLGRPKAHTSVTDSLNSTASAFGRQFTLSSSSETGSPLAPVAEIESMYNVLQHPLVQEEKKARQTKEGEGEEGEEEEEGEEGEERIFLNEALYSRLPSSNVAERDYDYVMPPDANTPQNISITVANDDQQRWAEPQRKGAELLSKGGGNSASTSSQTSLEAFYDFAREVGDSEKQKQGVGGGEEEETGLYDVVGPEHTPPTQTKTSHKLTKSAVAQPLPAIPGPSYSQDQGMIYEDVPDIPKNKRDIVSPALPVYDVVEHTREILKTEREAEAIIAVYDVLEEPWDKQKQEKSNIVSVYDVLQETAVYEAVESLPVTEKEKEEKKEEEGRGKEEGRWEEMYSEVGFEERTPPLVKSSVGRYINVAPGSNGGSSSEVTTGEESGRDYVNVSHSGDTPPIPARHATPTAPPNATPTVPPNATSTVPPRVQEDSCPMVTRPQPKPRTNSRPRNPNQLSSNPDQLPSNNNTMVDQSPSNRDIPPLSSPPLPNHASSEQIPIPSHERTDSVASSDLFPPSPSSPSSPPSNQKKFSPPPSPRSPRSLRPPSPLLSDRRASASARNTSPHSSTSSSPGNESYLATPTLDSSRQRSTSLKEKGIALFQRRQQEVACISEQDNQRRKRSLTMLRGVQDDTSLSPDDKILFAETLREVESERLKASEERFRWERERLQLEEERKLLQRERERLREEIENTRKELVQSL